MPLGYQAPVDRPRRSGALITLAVFCFIVGAGSLVMSGVLGVFWVYAASNSPPAPPPPPATAFPANAVQPIHGEIVGRYGLKAAERQPVLDALPLKDHPLADDMRLLVANFLADHGQRLRDRDGRIQVRPSTTRQPDKNAKLLGPVWLDFEVGEMQLTPTFLDYTPRSSSNRSEIATRGGTVKAAGLTNTDPEQKRRPWGSLAMQQMFDDLAAANVSLTPTQKGTVVAILQAERQVDPGMTQLMRQVSVDANGMLRFTTPANDKWYVLRDGRHVRESAAPAGVDSAAGIILPTVPPHQPMMPGERGWMLILGLHYCLNALLGLVLIVLGAMILRPLAWAAAALQVWCVAKFVVVFLELLWSVRFVQSIGPENGNASLPFASSAAITGTWQGVAVQLIFPIVALAILAKATSIRRYFLQMGQPTRVWTESPRKAGVFGWAIVGLLLLMALVHAVVVALVGFDESSVYVHLGGILAAVCVAVIVMASTLAGRAEEKTLGAA